MYIQISGTKKDGVEQRNTTHRIWYCFTVLHTGRGRFKLRPPCFYWLRKLNPMHSLIHFNFSAGYKGFVWHIVWSYLPGWTSFFLGIEIQVVFLEKEFPIWKYPPKTRKWLGTPRCVDAVLGLWSHSQFVWRFGLHPISSLRWVYQGCVLSNSVSKHGGQLKAVIGWQTAKKTSCESLRR